MKYSPIILFTYKRIDHTQKTINSLLKNKECSLSDLFIYSDAPQKKEDAVEVDKVRNFISKIRGFKSIHIIEQENNKGLADSITEGVSSVINNYGSCIVLEDDIVTSPFFLKYMNDAINKYKDNEKVMHINGWLPPIETNGAPDTFFSDRITPWGWATWKRAWDKFESDPKKLFNELERKNYIDKFNLDNSFNFTSSLKANIKGLIKTWAIKWQASVTLNDGLSLFPKESLSVNIGLDDSGENSKKDKISTKPQILSSEDIKINEISNLEINKELREEIKKYYKSIKPGMIEKVSFIIKKFIIKK